MKKVKSWLASLFASLFVSNKNPKNPISIDPSIFAFWDGDSFKTVDLHKVTRQLFAGGTFYDDVAMYRADSKLRSDLYKIWKATGSEPPFFEKIVRQCESREAVVVSQVRSVLDIKPHTSIGDAKFSGLTDAQVLAVFFGIMSRLKDIQDDNYFLLTSPARQAKYQPQLPETSN